MFTQLATACIEQNHANRTPASEFKRAASHIAKAAGLQILKVA
jgi:hypothetical protein